MKNIAIMGSSGICAGIYHYFFIVGSVCRKHRSSFKTIPDRRESSQRTSGYYLWTELSRDHPAEYFQGYRRYGTEYRNGFFSHISCPGLLVECGFLSNGLEASLLLTDGYQTRLSMAITGAYLHQMQMINRASGGI